MGIKLTSDDFFYVVLKIPVIGAFVFLTWMTYDCIRHNREINKINKEWDEKHKHKFN